MLITKHKFLYNYVEGIINFNLLKIQKNIIEHK